MVQVWDAYKREYCTVRSLLFCTINDYPALANLSGQSTKRAKACTHCLDDTESVWLKHRAKLCTCVTVGSSGGLTHTAG